MKKYLITLLLVVNMAIPVFVFAQADIDPNPDASSCVTITNNLRYRDRDANRNGEVSLLQDFLQSKGYLNSEPTGYFGLLTLRAVKSFQNANGITPASGYVGPITRTKIREITCDPSILQASLPQSVTNNTPTISTCSASSTPSIKVLSPNGGEVYMLGDVIKVKWQACNTSLDVSQSWVDRYDRYGNMLLSNLRISDLGLMMNYQRQIVGNSATGSFDIKIPNNGIFSDPVDGIIDRIIDLNISNVKYKVRIEAFDGPSDSSDSFFNINPSASASGCMPGYVYSSTTGLLCLQAQNASTVQCWSELNTSQSGVGRVYYPCNWVSSPIRGTSIGTSNSIVGVALKPSVSSSDSISIGGWQYDCSNVNVSGGNNPSTKAYCIRNINTSGVWSGSYITSINQGNINGTPMVTQSVNSQVLNIFDQIVQKNISNN